jgi:glucose-1-phosphate cytidylyltransferase
MKVLILCGGFGTRLSEHTEKIPKGLVQVGGKPILWHIMKFYSSFGFNKFILCIGYKSHLIQEYFKDNQEFEIEYSLSDPETKKAKRIQLALPLIDTDKFLVSYGDDLCDVDLRGVIDFHLQKDCIATLTTIQPRSNFGILKINEQSMVHEFEEKAKLDTWINGGFFMFDKKIFNYIEEGDELEKEVFQKLAKDKQLSAFRHYGFWQGMNTKKDQITLNQLWESNEARWKKW